ncbi:fatty acid desaturase [Rhodocytophaga rosea]|uniref:Fatty acid desaturase n=1 Tax=Rhodocytophaga rosea TaxID=2704465 RepID=A0A6C0GV00_9BACT|nr:fatty acid desaturase [Rhodocytophaga rosea]QHT71170.1 fatty acid desaturase [Rhodocytophaga rosea]
MKTFPVINDPVYLQQDSYNRFETMMLSYLLDKRDLPFVYLTIKITLVLIPLAAVLYMPLANWIWWIVALVYFGLNNLYFKGPLGLMLHCTCHRKLFNRKLNWANYYLPWFIGPFFGQTPETYFSHHIGMHHPENNLPADKSSTMFYQRDSFRSFLAYFSNFFFRGIVELTSYFYKKNRTKLLRNTVLGESLFFLMCIALSILNWQATLVVFILPFLISRFIMMLGNWTQHAFVDASDPGNPFKNSITCINTPYNKKCWNDGYHTSHHIKPNMHWTEHPNFFLKNKKEYADNQAIVFDGMGFLEVFFYLMRGRYDVLEKNFVNISGDPQRTPQQVISLLKERTRRIPKLSPVTG